MRLQSTTVDAAPTRLGATPAAGSECPTLTTRRRWRAAAAFAAAAQAAGSSTPAPNSSSDEEDAAADPSPDSDVFYYCYNRAREAVETEWRSAQGFCLKCLPGGPNNFCPCLLHPANVRDSAAPTRFLYSS